MIDEKFFDELEKLKDVRRKKIDEIKNRNLPVIIFGAAELGYKMNNYLKSYGVEISGFAVDEKYYKPGQTYLNRPVYNFSELSAQPDKYIFILGVGGDHDGGRRAEEFFHDQRLIKYFFPVSVCGKIDYDFIHENKKKFSETLNWLEDDFSKLTMKNFFKVHLTNDYTFNIEISRPNQYFNELTEPARGGYSSIAAHIAEILSKNLSGGAEEVTKKFLRSSRIR